LDHSQFKTLLLVKSNNTPSKSVEKKVTYLIMSARKSSLVWTWYKYEFQKNGRITHKNMSY
jgi:hypothetical protein